jgi:hypothetical protein
MPETRPESCSRLANTAKRPSCAVSARCNEHAVTLEMFVPAANQDLPPPSPLAGRRHHALLDHDAAVGELRSLYGWPESEDPHGSGDDDGAGPEPISERLRDCARRLVLLDLGEYPPVTNPRSEADHHPERCNVVVDVRCVRRVPLRIAADIDELVPARRPNPSAPEATAGRIAVGYRPGPPGKPRTDRVGQTGSYRSPSAVQGDLSNC